MQITGLLGSSYGANPLDFALNLARNHRAQWARSFSFASQASGLKYWTAVGGDGKRYSIDLVPSGTASAATIATAMCGWAVKRPDAFATGAVRAFSPFGLDGIPPTELDSEVGEPLTATAIVGLIVVIIPLLTQILPVILPPLIGMLGDGIDAITGGGGGAPKPPPIPLPGGGSSVADESASSSTDELVTFLKSPIGLGALAVGGFLLLRSR